MTKRKMTKRKSLQITIDQVKQAIREPTRYLFASDTGGVYNKHFYVCHDPNRYNPYHFEVEATCNSDPSREVYTWSSDRAEDMVERFNGLA